MKIFHLLFIFLFTAFAQAQDSTTVKSYSSILNLGEQFVFEDKAVKFKSLISDSRCPENVTCVWPGEAKVLVEVFKEGKLLGEEVLVIAAGGSRSNLFDKLFSGVFSLKALSLQPYPRTAEKMEASEYKLGLQVTKSSENL